jgi:hypothetical protein
LTVNDPSFGEIEFSIDAWDGLAPFEYRPSGTTMFAVHVWADESGPSAVQRATFDQLKAHYVILWPSIAKALRGCHASPTAIVDVANCLNPTVGCYIETESGGAHAAFELVYAFDLPGENGRGYFVRIVEWEVAEAFVAD